MSHKLQFEAWVPVPLPRVFAFFANPENLPRLMPRAADTRVETWELVLPAQSLPDTTLSISQSAGKGSVIHTSFRPVSFLPWRRKWTAAITEFEWNKYFVDVQQQGPFKRWRHRHEFIAVHRKAEDGTLVRDVIEYEVGFGVLGSLINSLVIERELRGMFAHRHEALCRILA